MENTNQKMVKTGDENPVNRTSKTEINYMEELNGCEIWTNAFGDRFGERVCVGVDGENCYHDGKNFKPTKKEIKGLWDDYIEQELGTPTQIQKELEEEFGTKMTEEGY